MFVDAISVSRGRSKTHLARRLTSNLTLECASSMVLNVADSWSSSRHYSRSIATAQKSREGGAPCLIEGSEAWSSSGWAEALSRGCVVVVCCLINIHISMSRLTQVYHVQGQLPMAFDNEHMMHSILCVAARQRSYLQPQDPRHRTAEILTTY
ncbi:hypothetical protein P175DRAFT_02938 [Aspergillus ochraceoroseus IBT 24754]|uniref:Uncharacterized protein n=1 Tax=Aspergillus ochraceoroseus IBT 24754 TaxID=1392256 RepID=A0A2T5M5D1_9EURO|nr:uncharacterized protein P175DRAFT_02938 [Aspergillus ochraceoroseus IBT 24754]PTU23724.1 hypothetical protein P175DRAFT_02938 [Aspergillus ochraceoroseus IBT 24754]